MSLSTSVADLNRGRILTALMMRGEGGWGGIEGGR